jgi:hypothetical protein
MDAAGSTAGASAALLEDLAAANITPWSHQLDAISKIVTTKTKRCLVQHAAGAGKSLTIAGLASSLADDGFRVVVVCDRRQLDAQIYATVRRVCQRRHSVGRASSVADLATATETILCTTLQKVSRASQQTRHGKTAVLVDECHRSYADENVWRRLDEALGAPSLIVRFRAQIRFDASARWRDGVDLHAGGLHGDARRSRTRDARQPTPLLPALGRDPARLRARRAKGLPGAPTARHCV